MGAFTRIPANTFDEIQTNAGVLLYKFDPATPEIADEDIICPTTGGVNIFAKPSYSDYGEDVDNCPAGLLELMNLDTWDTGISTTCLGTSPKSIRLALGAADIDTEDPTHIVPRKVKKMTDATDIWWVGDKANGGMLAACLKKALSSDGFSLQTTKNGKGQTTLALSGHPTVETQGEVPIEFWSKDPDTATDPGTTPAALEDEE